MNVRPAPLRFEPLEERLALDAAMPVPAELPFAPAAQVAEAENAFIGTPAPAAASGEYYVGTYHDVNQGGSDMLRSLAASAANAIAYTNWGYAVAAPGVTPSEPLFHNDDEIYDYLAGKLSESGGISQLIGGSSGYKQSIIDALNSGIAELYPGFSGRDYYGRPIWNITDADAAAMSEAATLLKQGYGIVAAVGLYLGRTPEIPIGVRAVTIWGYTYNTGLSPSNPAYYTGLIVSDSADGQTGTATYSLEWNSSYQQYRLVGFGAVSAWLENLITLRPITPLTGVTLTGYDGPYDGQTHTVTIAGISEADSASYRVSYDCNGILFDRPLLFKQPGSNTIKTVVIKNNYEAIWSAPVIINIAKPDPVSLAAPKISSAVSAGRNAHTVAWSAVAGASGYEIAWSADGGESWSNRTVETPECKIKNLPYGKEVLYRVRALGDGINTAASGWSAVKTLLANPSDIDGDRFIGPGDFALISAVWFTLSGDDGYDPRLDIDGDGFIGPGDFTFLSANWFKNADDPDLFFPQA